MPARRAPIDIDIEQRELSRADACRILQVAPNADGELITKAYWHLARKYRAYAPSDPESRDHLDELNRAYVILNPASGEAPLAKEMPPLPPPPEPGFFDQVFAGWQKLVAHTKAVWPEHVGEVTALSATTAMLTYLALAAGASALLTLAAAGVAGLAIWAPWRRTG